MLSFSPTSVHSQIIDVTNPPEVYRCENISQIEICSQVGYSFGTFPNWREQETQFLANSELEQFRPLIESVCSNAIVHLLCAVYAPFCDPTSRFAQTRLPPCRELCDFVRMGCEDDLNRYDLAWPPHLDCDRYPTKDEFPLAFCHDNPEQLMIPPNIETNPVTVPGTDVERNGTDNGMFTVDISTDISTMDPGVRFEATCPASLNISSDSTLRGVNKKYVFAGLDNCAMNCSGIYFSEVERNILAPVFVLIFAIGCVIFTLFTVATFLIDRRRFHYPERPIIFLSFCYLIISVAYIVGSISKLAGTQNRAFSCSDDEHITLKETVSYVFQRLPNSQASYKSASCVILFVMVYYFQMASAIWWVVLTLTWFLAAAMKWGEEAVERLWLLYHVLAWCIPALQVVIVMALQLVDGDQLSGLCYTGNANSVGLGVFVFLPLTFYLVLGIVFLVIGFTALINIRNQLQKDPAKSRKLGRLIVRIAVYSTLYIIPNLVLLILLLYELAKTNEWQQHYIIQCGSSTDPNCVADITPSFAAFIIKYFALFSIGICSTSWILSSKTVSAWQKFFCSCGCNGSNDGGVAMGVYDYPEKRGDLGLHPQTAV